MRTSDGIKHGELARGRRRVLILSTEDLSLQGTCLGAPTVERLHVQDIRAAFARAREHQPRLTVVDTATPGAEHLIRRLRLHRQTRDTAIVALSRTPDLADEPALKQAGANLVLVPPVSPAVWDGPVRRLLEVPPRRSGRLAAAFEVWDDEASNPPRRKATALNISIHGALLETAWPIAVGAKIDVTVTLPGGPVRALAEVVRDGGSSARRHRRGVQFLVLRGDSAARIAAFVGDGRAKTIVPRVAETAQWEAELRAGDTRLRGILEWAPEAMILFDEKGRVREINRAAEGLFGRARETVLGQVALDRLLPDPARQLLRCALAQQLVAAEHLLERPMEVSGQRADGGAFTAELTFTRFAARGEVFWAVHARDAVHRRHLVDELQATQRRFRALLENSADGIALLERDGRFRDLTASAARMFGYSPGELVGRTFDELLDADDVEVVRTLRRRSLAEPGTALSAEVRCLHRDGTRRVIEGVLVNHLDTPEVRAFVVNYRDVTHRHRALHLEEELRQAQKIEALGRLAGGVAHDFNNLIGVILGASRLAAATASDIERHKRLETVQQAAEKAAALTRQLLAFSRKQVLMPEIVDVGAAVRELAGMLDRLLGEQVELVTLVPARMGRVRVDRSQLEQALTNLVVNARDAMPDGGRVLFEASDADIDAELAGQLLGVPPGPYVRLSVSDTGVGMDDATQRRVFEPFFTTKEKGKGTGLGLATTYGIVKQSGGHITVESAVGRGSTFTIFLPRVEERASRLDDRPAPRPPRSGETILLAEDDPMLRRIACDILQSAGYVILDADSAGAALELSRRHHAPLPLLVTDVVMPGMSGRQLAEQLVSERPETRVLYISGYTDDEIVRHGIVERTVDLLEKPFTPESLCAAVRRVLDRGRPSASRAG